MKIAFVLLRTIGVVVLGNILVNEIKKKYPDGEITYFVEEKYLDIIKNNPNIEEFYMVKKAVDSWDSILFELATDKWDKVFVPYQTTHTDNIWHHRLTYNTGHLLDFYAQKCGLTNPPRKLQMYPLETDAVEVKPNTIAIHTTTLVQSKNWNKFQALSGFLKAKGFNVAQVGLKSDAQIYGAEDLREKYSFNQLAMFFSKCKYFIGLDSGLSYIAATTDTRAVIIQGATIPRTSGPFGPNVRYVLAPTREECKAQRCHGNCRFKEPCINKIPVDKVLEVIQ